MPNCIRAVILAAGMRARLHPYSDLVPMRSVGMSGILMLHNVVHQLSVLGIRKAGAVIRDRCEAFTGCCREFLQQELRTASPTRWSLTAIACPMHPRRVRRSSWLKMAPLPRSAWTQLPLRTGEEALQDKPT